MYKCNDCGFEFYEASELEETHNEIPAPNIKHFHGCPRCRSSDYEELSTCCMCEESYLDSSDFLKFDNGDTVCNDCLRDYCKERFICYG